MAKLLKTNNSLTSLHITSAILRNICADDPPLTSEVFDDHFASSVTTDDNTIKPDAPLVSSASPRRLSKELSKIRSSSHTGPEDLPQLYSNLWMQILGYRCFSLNYGTFPYRLSSYQFKKQLRSGTI